MRRLHGLCCLLLLGLSGCGGFFVPQTSSGGTTNTGDYLYVANSANTFFAGFGVASSGALSVLSGSPYNNSVAAQSLAVNPANTFLYAATTAGIYVYGISSNGSITVQNDGSPSAADDMVATAMQVDSTGNYLLAVGISTAQQVQAIAIYTIDTSTGLLTAVAGSPLTLYTGNASTPTVVAPTGLLITPNNSYVYASLGALGVQVLTLGSGGALAAGATPTLLAPLTNSTSPLTRGPQVIRILHFFSSPRPIPG